MASAAPNIDPVTRKATSAFLSQIASRYNVAGALLYGSRARGDHTPESDADVAVLLNGAKGQTAKVAVDMAATEFDVMLDTGVLISAIPIWLEDWEHPERHSNPYLIANIQREGVPL